MGGNAAAPLIRRQLAAGKVIVFGPVADPKGPWGLGVLRVRDEAEIASFELLNEDAQSITEAANKLPPEVVPDKKAKKSN